jgi:outer membrane biosynthesis protein TonB
MDINLNVKGTVKVELTAQNDLLDTLKLINTHYPQPAAASNGVAPVTEPKEEPKEEPKAEPKAESKEEPKEEPKSEPKEDAPITEDEKVELRKLSSAFIHADAGNKAVIKKWLTDNNVERISSIPESLLASFKELVTA